MWLQFYSYRLNLSGDHTWRCQRVMWFHRWIPIIISHKSVMSGGHRPCRRGDFKILICYVITWSESHLTLWASFSHHKSPTAWWPHVLRKRRYFVFHLSSDLMWPCCQRVMWHYRWVLLIMSYYRAMFGGHRCCAIDDNSFLDCHATSRDYIVREIMGEFPSSSVTTL